MRLDVRADLVSNVVQPGRRPAGVRSVPQSRRYLAALSVWSVSIGLPKENARFLEALAKVLSA